MWIGKEVLKNIQTKEFVFYKTTFEKKEQCIVYKYRGKKREIMVIYEISIENTSIYATYIVPTMEDYVDLANHFFEQIISELKKQKSIRLRLMFDQYKIKKRTIFHR